jgi:hypothetical protein
LDRVWAPEVLVDEWLAKALIDQQFTHLRPAVVTILSSVATRAEISQLARRTVVRADPATAVCRSAVASGDCLGHYSADIKDVLSRGFSEAGYPGAIRRVGDRLAVGVNGVYVAPIDVYIAYLYTGQKDVALEWLLKSVEAQDQNVSGWA